jgi:hypothetical protein
MDIAKPGITAPIKNPPPRGEKTLKEPEYVIQSQIQKETLKIEGYPNLGSTNKTSL